MNIITNYNSSLDHGGMGCQKEQKKKVGGGVSVRVCGCGCRCNGGGGGGGLAKEWKGMPDSKL